MYERWDWEAVAGRLGAKRDGRFNAGAVPIEHPSAVVWRRHTGRDEIFSGDTIQRRARRVANALRRGGVRPGDRVAGLMGRRPGAFIVPLAVWRLGAIYVPLFSGFRRDAISVRLEDSGATTVVTDLENRGGLAGIEGRLTIFLTGGTASDGELDLDREADEEDELQEVAETRLDDPASIMYTSGTSGTPKGCVIPHRGIINLAPYVKHCLALETSDLMFSTADTGWSFGLYTSGLATLALGYSRLLYEGGFDARGWWQAMRELGVTHIASAPTGFGQLAVKGAAAMGETPGFVRAGTAGGSLSTRMQSPGFASNSISPCTTPTVSRSSAWSSRTFAAQGRWSRLPAQWAFRCPASTSSSSTKAARGSRRAMRAT